MIKIKEVLKVNGVSARSDNMAIEEIQMKDEVNGKTLTCFCYTRKMVLCSQ